MGIYLPNMEMPKDCLFCPMFHGAWAMCNVLDKTTSAKGRPDDCPLVPVPPHGRLIDADALRQSIKDSIDECHKWAEEVEGGEMYARVSQSLGTFVECSLRVKAAPTIIPEEEGE